MAARRAAAPVWRALGCGAAAACSSHLSVLELFGAAAAASRLLSTAAAGGTEPAPPGGPAAQEGGGDSAPVVIAGGGPTGLTTALLLAKLGVPSVVLERSRALTDHPQAHFINMRCMEVLRGLGGGQAAGLACTAGLDLGRARQRMAALVPRCWLLRGPAC